MRPSVSVVFPRAAPSLEIREMYRRLEARDGRYSVLDLDTVSQIREALDDPDRLVVSWGLYDFPGVSSRKARTGLVFFEPLGPFDRMLGDHVGYVAEVWKSLRNFDCLFLHTPAMVKRMGDLVETPCFLLPVGWDPRTSSEVDGSSKRRAFLHWGSIVGDRAPLLDRFGRLLGEELTHVVGLFGDALRGELDASRAALYLPHSRRVRSFSTWRLWQVLASSAALVVPRGSDAWPFVEGEHCASFDLDGDGSDLRALSSDRLAAIARRARDGVGVRFEVDRCAEELLRAREVLARRFPR